MGATLCFDLRAAVLVVMIGGCGGKAGTQADGQAGAPDDPHHGHDHAGGPHHGHDHADGPRPEPQNPYIYEPTDVQAERLPEPEGPPAGAMSFAGVTFEVAVDGKKETLTLSDEVLAKRPQPIANWDCNPQYGVVNLVDFAIAEDPQKAGSVFVIRVDAAKPEAMRAGTQTNARLSVRRVGELGLTTARGVATWDPGYKSGRAIAQTGLDYTLEVRWTCAERPAQ